MKIIDNLNNNIANNCNKFSILVNIIIYMDNKDDNIASRYNNIKITKSKIEIIESKIRNLENKIEIIESKNNTLECEIYNI